MSKLLSGYVCVTSHKMDIVNVKVVETQFLLLIFTFKSEGQHYCQSYLIIIIALAVQLVHKQYYFLTKK